MSKVKDAIARLSKSTARLVASATGIKSAAAVLLKTQEALDKASARLALAATRLKQASDSIRLNSWKDKIHLEDTWEVEITYQEEKGYLDIISVTNIKTGETFASLRFDRCRQIFVDKHQPNMSAEAKATLAQALGALTKDVVETTGVLN